MHKLSQDTDDVIVFGQTSEDKLRHIVIWADDKMRDFVADVDELPRGPLKAKPQLLLQILSPTSPFVTAPSQVILCPELPDVPMSHSFFSESAPRKLVTPDELTTQHGDRQWANAWVGANVRKAGAMLQDTPTTKYYWILDVHHAGISKNRDKYFLRTFAPPVYSLIRAFDNHHVLLLTGAEPGNLYALRNELLELGTPLDRNWGRKLGIGGTNTGTHERFLEILHGTTGDGDKAFEILSAWS